MFKKKLGVSDIPETKKVSISTNTPPRIPPRLPTLPTTSIDPKREVLPGIEPGLPEDTDFEIRIRSDNRYLDGY